MNNDGTYKVGMYIRLSKEDCDKNGKKLESESITNQRDLILKFIKENNYNLYDEYVDDGFSGTTFDRPAFKRLIKDIEAKKINMVITKDLSRLGRDHIYFGYYVERFFPENGIRYIAILDRVDTMIDSAGNEMVPLKAVFNEWYCRDTSKKIISIMSNKKSQGLYLGNRAPYGYKKDPNDKHKLIIDNDAAEVVKLIFSLFIKGMGCRNICRELNNRGIPTPSQHMKMPTAGNKWYESFVFKIIRNPVYQGTLVQNKRMKVSYKSKMTRYRPKDQWIISENTHEPIIDKETFEKAQNLCSKVRSGNLHSHNILLRGFMKCKECGHTIGVNQSTDKARYYTLCNGYKRDPKSGYCTAHIMRYEYLEELVLKDIRRMCKKCIDVASLENILKNKSNRNKKLEEINFELKKSSLTLNQTKHQIEEMYYDKLNGIIDVETYKNIYNKLINTAENIEMKINELKNKKTKIQEQDLNINEDYKKIIEKFLSLKKEDINIDMLASIIDKITIDKDKNIEVFYKIKPVI